MSTSQNMTLAVAIVGAATGLLGAVLGIINTWKSIGRERVKLRIVPKVAEVHAPGQDPTPRMCIEAVNMSCFPITISGVGFSTHSRSQLVVAQPIVLDGKPWPRRLEPREAVTVYLSPQLMLEPKMLLAKAAYVKTDCGITKEGTGPALASYIEELAKLHAEAAK